MASFDSSDWKDYSDWTQRYRWNKQEERIDDMSNPVQDFADCIEMEGLDYAIRFKRTWENEFPHAKRLVSAISRYKKAADQIEAWIAKNLDQEDN